MVIEQNLDDLLPPLSKKDGKSPRHNGNQSSWAASPEQQVILSNKLQQQELLTTFTAFSYGRYRALSLAKNSNISKR